MSYIADLIDRGHPPLTEYAKAYPRGKIPVPRDRRLWPTFKKSVANRMAAYVKLCRQAAKNLASEDGGAWREVWHEQPHPSDLYRPDHLGKWKRRWQMHTEPNLVLRHATGWARFMQTEDTERDRLIEDTAKAVEFWRMVENELRAV